MLWTAWSEEWALAEPVSFDGRNKHIVINGGVEAMSIQTLYSAWKRWVQREHNAMYLPAMQAVGGDPIPGGVTGSTYFMINGWKLVYDPTKVAVSGVLYSSDFDTAYWGHAGEPIYPATVSALVNSAVSYQNVVTGTALTEEQTAVAVWGYINRTLTSAPSPTVEAIVASIFAAAQSTPIKADMVETNGVGIKGDGTANDKFRSVLIT